MTTEVPRVWSAYQNACFNFIANEHGNATVIAVAGSGKTTTGVEMVKRIPAGRSHIFLAFNKSIAEELKSKGINARTFHSLCFSPVTRAKSTNGVESGKLRAIIDAAVAASESEDPNGKPIYHQTPTGEWYQFNSQGEQIAPAIPVMGKRDSYRYSNFIIRLVGLARNSGVGCLCQNIPEVWHGLIEYHDLELDDESAKVDTAVEFAMQLLEWSNRSTILDFDDLLYIVVKDGISLPKFDYVFVDEAQDTNSIQRAILRKIMKPHTRLIAVGDPAQAIYGFRGADSNSMQMIADEFGCKELPLTVTYRCPTSVVNYAKRWVSHIEPAPGASGGIVKNLDTEWKLEQFQEDDLIVCRTTKPIIALAYELLKNRIPARVLGRDIGEGLKSLIKKMKAHSIDALIERLDEYTSREVEKARAKGKDAKAESVQDKTASVMCLIDGLPEDDRNIPTLLAEIDDLFSESRFGVKLATIHKSKGLEADRVYWLNASKCPAPWARQPWQQQQEKNLCYIAVTRAKKELYLIEAQSKNVFSLRPHHTENVSWEEDDYERIQSLE